MGESNVLLRKLLKKNALQSEHENLGYLSQVEEVDECESTENDILEPQEHESVNFQVS